MDPKFKGEATDYIRPSCKLIMNLPMHLIITVATLFQTSRASSSLNFNCPNLTQAV